MLAAYVSALLGNFLQLSPNVGRLYKCTAGYYKQGNSLVCMVAKLKQSNSGLALVLSIVNCHPDRNFKIASKPFFGITKMPDQNVCSESSTSKKINFLEGEIHLKEIYSRMNTNSHTLQEKGMSSFGR